jgi:2-methylaconitate cis-trans-isomerase PrpF
MGSPDRRQIDGAGGGDPLTSKVAIVERSDRPNADIDYLFAQVAIDQPIVDTNPNCGNILAAVAPYAIEAGLVTAMPGETLVRVYNVNTQSVMDVIVQTPNGVVTYEGETRIDGAPGRGAPILIDFRDAVGAKTKQLLPANEVRTIIDGIAVSCIDMAMPMVIIPAESLGKTGFESKGELDSDTELLVKIERIRQAASHRMQLGDATDKVIPKVALVARPRDGFGLVSRYFTPKVCHAAHAVTGAVCLAVAAGIKGTIAYDLVSRAPDRADIVRIQHPSGFLDVEVITTGSPEATMVERAAVLRTARRIFEGSVVVNLEDICAQESMAA